MAIDHERLIFRKLLGVTSPGEDIQLQRWLKADRRHEQLYKERKRSWLRQIREAPEFVPGPRVAPRKRPLIVGKRSRSFYVAESVAVALLVIATFIIYSGLSNRPSVYRAGSDIRTVVLDDSTRATLRPGTILLVSSRYANGDRTVELKGEAAFDVREDSLKPFTVLSPYSRIKVLGTSFSVGLYPALERDEVRVKSGKVLFSSLADPEREVVVPAGKMGVLHRDSRVITLQKADTTNMLAWKRKELIFANTPLTEVAGTVSDYFGVSVRIESEKMKNCPITRTFKDPVMEDVIEHIQRSLDAIVIKEYGGLVIRGDRSCTPSRRK